MPICCCKGEGREIYSLISMFIKARMCVKNLRLPIKRIATECGTFLPVYRNWDQSLSLYYTTEKRKNYQRKRR